MVKVVKKNSFASNHAMFGKLVFGLDIFLKIFSPGVNKGNVL